MYTLNNSDINTVCEKLKDTLTEHRISGQNGMRIRLSVEEILLIYRDQFGQDTEIDVKTEKRFGSLRIALAIRCDSFNPIEDISEEEILLRRMMESMEYLPV